MLRSPDARSGITSELALTLKTDPRTKEEVDEQVVIIENITRGDS